MTRKKTRLPQDIDWNGMTVYKMWRCSWKFQSQSLRQNLVEKKEERSDKKLRLSNAVSCDLREKICNAAIAHIVFFHYANIVPYSNTACQKIFSSIAARKLATILATSFFEFHNQYIFQAWLPPSIYHYEIQMANKNIILTFHNQNFSNTRLPSDTTELIKGCLDLWLELYVTYQSETC